MPKTVETDLYPYMNFPGAWLDSLGRPYSVLEHKKSIQKWAVNRLQSHFMEGLMNCPEADSFVFALETFEAWEDWVDQHKNQHSIRRCRLPTLPIAARYLIVVFLSLSTDILEISCSKSWILNAYSSTIGLGGPAE